MPRHQGEKRGKSGEAKDSKSGARARGRIGGLSTSSRHDPRQYTAAARRKFNERFEREVDPEGVLPSKERARRANAAKRAYFSRLALKSARARERSITACSPEQTAPDLGTRAPAEGESISHSLALRKAGAISTGTEVE